MKYLKDPIPRAIRDRVTDNRARIKPAHERGELHLVLAAVGRVEVGQPNDARARGLRLDPCCAHTNQRRSRPRARPSQSKLL